MVTHTFYDIFGIAFWHVTVDGQRWSLNRINEPNMAKGKLDKNSNTAKNMSSHLLQSTGSIKQYCTTDNKSWLMNINSDINMERIIFLWGIQ